MRPVTIPAGTAAGGAALGSANIFTTGPQEIDTGGDGVVGLILRRNSATQSVNIFEVRQSVGEGGAVLASIKPGGAIETSQIAAVGAGAAITCNPSGKFARAINGLSVTASATGSSALDAIAAGAGQSVNIVNIQNSTPTTVAFFDKKGRLGVSQTAHVAGDYVLSAGFGTTATVTVTRGADGGGIIVVNSAGTGQVANPTVTLTYKDGAWGVAPIVVVSRGDINAPATAVWVVTSSTTTTAVFTFLGTPVAGTSYTFHFHTLG